MATLNYTDVPLLVENCSPCSPDEERIAIKELDRSADQNLKEGDVFFLIDASWLRGWQEYVGYFYENTSFNGNRPHTSLRPGRIDNSKLASFENDEQRTGVTLRRNLQEGEDYMLVPLEVWKKLHEWYQGGPELPRKIISEGVNTKQLTVEVYPLSLKLVDARDQSEKIITISRSASVEKLYSMVCELVSLDQEKVDIWDNFDKQKPIVLTNSNETIQEAQLQMDQEILLKIKDDLLLKSYSGKDSTGNQLALLPMEPFRSPITIAGGLTSTNSTARPGTYPLEGTSFSSSLRDPEEDVFLGNATKIDGRGLTGLNNLGNTCFMNSALQCLVHTPNLAQFFLDDYTQEINELNPLGMKGELAIAFGDLLRELWSSKRTSVAPRTFKSTLARFAPQFIGYNQHDSQELLAFLLDGLHEDLNRVRNKPYIEAKDPNGRPDDQYASECWEVHKARNDSIIVDVCQGQYKSTVVCPVCAKVSVTFDPFMYLSLPLPSTTTRSMTVTVFTGDGSSIPIPFTVDVPKNGVSRDLHQALCTACNLPSSEDLLLAEVFDSRIYRYLDFYDSLSVIRDDDHLVAYKLPKNYKEFMRLEISHHRASSLLEHRSSIPQELHFGTPLVTILPKEAKTGADLYSVVSALLSSLSRCKAHISPLSTSPNSTILTYDTDPSSSDSELSTSFMEIVVEDDETVAQPLKLILTDEKGNNQSPVDGDTVVNVGSCVRVLLEWSEKTTELYSFEYLDDSPEVSKPVGFLAKKPKQESLTLFSCLDSFLKEEPLGPDDMWFCPGCKEHRQATKKLDLWRLPEVLVVHLKRFSYSRFLKNKLNTFVDFPVHDLDLGKYVNHSAAASAVQSYVYELYAISNHYGGLGGGHYTAYAKVIEGNTWYHFDDSHVSSITEDSIKTQAAYVLFYRRVKK